MKRLQHLRPRQQGFTLLELIVALALSSLVAMVGTVALSSRLLESNLSLLRSLGNAIAKRDADTDAHNYRVTCYAVTLAEAVGVDKETITELVLGAFLHDVGKIGIPDQILLKPGRLTSEEFQVMQTHAVLGIEIVAGNPWLAGAPKFGDKAAWAPFIAKGMDDMVKKATQGVGAMPPKGGSTASDADFKAAIHPVGG